MMENSDRKKRNFYTIVLILTLITMFVGASFAYFSLVSSQKKDGTHLYTGKLEINYIDGVYIKNPILRPISNPNQNTEKNIYRNSFTVASSGTLEQTINIKFIISKNEFSENSLKYALYNENGNRLSIGNVPKTGEVELASNLYLEPVGTAKYTLIVWLDENGYNQNYDMNKTITGRITINSVQLKY